MWILSFFILCAFAALPWQLAAAPTPERTARLDRIMTESEAADRTHLALRIADPETGEVLYDHNGRKLFTPASVLKLYTSACALEEFGPGYRFETEVGISGFISGDRLGGDLVLRAGGDPMLDTEDLRDLARRVREELHLSYISGDIVVDATLFDSPLKGPGWMWDDDPDTYNMSVEAPMLDFNVLTVQVQPNGHVRLEPPTTYPPLVNQLSMGAEETEIQITRKPFDDTITVSGTLADDAEATSESLTMHRPALWAGNVFRTMLLQEGIGVEGPVRLAEERITIEPLLVSESEPLSEIIWHFNKYSENAIGEMLLHHMALLNGEVPATWSSGAEAITRWLENVAGLPEEGFRLVDGSGLSRYNMISAESTVALLNHMYSSRDFSVSRGTLPIYEAPLPDGSTADPERVFAKPGGMTGVATYGGFIETLEGRTLVFSLLANGYIGSVQPVRDVRQQVFGEVIIW